MTAVIAQPNFNIDSKLLWHYVQFAFYSSKNEVEKKKQK